MEGDLQRPINLEYKATVQSAQVSVRARGSLTPTVSEASEFRFIYLFHPLPSCL